MSEPNRKKQLTKEALESCIELIRNQYFADGRPWVIGYSGGKDSTCVLQLVWRALASIERERLKKQVYVITSDTLVETPSIVSHLASSLQLISQSAKEQGLPIEPCPVTPAIDQTFWVNLIGRGYPAPYSNFRWCTERMKIQPATEFIKTRIAQYGEVLIILGARKAESGTRAQVMQSEKVVEKKVIDDGTEKTIRKKVGRRELSTAVSRHKDIPSAYVFTPIEDWTTEDVWSYLISTPSPWGADNRELVTMYRNAQGGECPLVIDKTTPSCGGGRFGCWVCTVVDRDRSMEAMIDNGEDWLQPLLEFRDRLRQTQEPSAKPSIREYRRRNGRIEFFESEGETKVRYGPYKLEFRHSILAKLLQAQTTIRRTHPDVTLITEPELVRIRQIWQQEEGDWEDSLPKIYEEVTGQSIDWLVDDWSGMGGAEKQILQEICDEVHLPVALLMKLMDVERSFSGMSRRSGIYKKLDEVLKNDWRSLEDARAALPAKSTEVATK